MRVFDKVNAIYGLIATVMTAMLGQYWFLFAGFLILNMIDYLTGLAKARRLKQESSSVGAWGVLKKVAYWLVIGVAFFISFAFVQMGEIIGINLSFTILLGWFTLASYLVNEIRSILENLIEMDVNVPTWLVKGLEITNKLIDSKVNTFEEDKKATK